MGTIARKEPSIQTEYLTKKGLNIPIGSKRSFTIHHMTKKISSARILYSVHKVYLKGDHRNNLLSNIIISLKEYEFIKKYGRQIGQSC